MPTNPQAIAKKTYLGVALEAVPLTSALTTNLKYIPTKGELQQVQHEEWPDEDRNTVNSHTTRVDTNREGTFGAKGVWYPDTTALLLWSLIGAPTTSQPAVGTDPTVYKHTITQQDIPPTLSVYKNWHRVTYFAAGGAVNKLSLKWDSKKMLEADASGICLFPQKYTGSALTPTFSTVKPFSGWMPSITLGGGATGDVNEMTITFNRDVAPWFPSSGVQDFTRLDYGARSATIEFTARFDLETLYATYFTGRTFDNISVDFLGPIISNTYHQELNLVFPVVSYDDAKIDPGKENVLVKVKCTCMPDGSDNLVTGYVQNTVTAYTAS